MKPDDFKIFERKKERKKGMKGNEGTKRTKNNTAIEIKQ